MTKSVMLYTSTYGKTNAFVEKQNKSQAQDFTASHGSLLGEVHGQHGNGSAAYDVPTQLLGG
jgi:hypothetical protein